ncbi:NAD(P)/FAD-dependent oxidoreductase [Paenibacillus taichungensis]|uniref:NAD(P)/FAD-dependent oxidoreductase n=1 Tax=Paenibacillus taichungensis TaxID=484184 RepID=UPI0038CF6F69
MENNFDVVIIGGGPAGLNAALVLGRSRKNVIVIDDVQPRNRVTKETHGFLTRDGVSLDEFRRIAIEQISSYPSVKFSEETVETITGTDGQFTIKTSNGTVYQSKKIVFTVGKKDKPLDIEGLAAVYGKSAFVCTYCDAWELRNQPLVIIVKNAKSILGAKMLSGWSNQLTVCTDGPNEWTDEQREDLKQHNIDAFDSPIDRIESIEGMVQQIILKDGTTIPCKGIFFAPKLVSGSNLPRELGCEINDAGSVVVDTFGKTNVPGIYSAGDVASELYQAVTAASMGALAAMSINSELQLEAWENLSEFNLNKNREQPLSQTT